MFSIIGTSQTDSTIRGLKDLTDLLPVSLATIVSYLSAETTRGLWKPASMNGTDWPSPATNLSMVEQNINKILAATGVDVPSLSAGGTTSASLPLPLAALVSLTITYKVDKVTEPLLNLVGPAVTTIGAGCPWPSMSIIAALWTQKAKRWTDHLVFTASRTVFHHSNDAVIQLLKVCFQSTLGLNSPIGGVGNLLGHGFGSHCTGGIAAVAPGILYLRVHRSVRDVMFMTEEIVSLLLRSVKDIVSTDIPIENLKRPKSGTVIRYGEVSLSLAMTRIKLAASLGASLVWITGGLNLIQTLIKETLPCWFISVHRSDLNKVDSGGMIGMLKGYALAYFTVLSAAFAWGLDSVSSASKKRPVILEAHLGFMARALDCKISLGCNRATWRAYVSCFVSLMVSCTSKWVREVDVEILRSLSRGLRKWDEEELALALLRIGGMSSMGAAAEFIIESSV
ncbi:mediator of RNA polymerase II transcription subunit 33A-like protein [Tanacetum coccineum]|uniref:Mediator of RNA polymerase II transcription subunit 33A-like protein n=1 Tax=Tanacetum coccineum TaxID=301880 RepID=A0ABQ4Y115_9ASTR